MGRKLVLTGTTLTDTAAPFLAELDRLESPGSLMLVDPTHPTGGWAAGVPTSNTRVTNVLADTARQLIGPAAEVRPLWRQQSDAGVQPTVTRTTTGGLYTSGKFAGLTLPVDVAHYVVTNPGHAFYISLWGHRGTTTGFTSASQIYHGTLGMVYNFPATAVTTSGTVLGSAGFPIASGSHFRAAAAVQGFTATGTGQQLVDSNAVTMFGTWGGLTEAARRTFRYYLEDLTVSGRTWTEVNALDSYLHTREVLTPGGRYYGDAI